MANGGDMASHNVGCLWYDSVFRLRYVPLFGFVILTGAKLRASLSSLFSFFPDVDMMGAISRILQIYNLRVMNLQVLVNANYDSKV